MVMVGELSMGEWSPWPLQVSDRESQTASPSMDGDCNGKPMLQASGCLTVHKRFKTLKNAILGWIR